MSEKSKEYEDSEIKRLYRSKHDRMLAGVCGGFAEYFQLESVLIRIIWVIISLFGGIGLILYIAGIIIIPDNPEHSTEPEEKDKTHKTDKSLFWGAVLIVIGIGLLLRQLGFFYYFNFWDIPWQMIWAISLILVGIFLLYNRSAFKLKKDDNDDANLTDDTKDRKQIYRSKNNKMIAGVCGGLAEYFDLDPTLVRLAYVLLSLASVGMGVVAYIIMLIVFPEMPDQSSITSIERKK